MVIDDVEGFVGPSVVLSCMPFKGSTFMEFFYLSFLVIFKL